MTSDAVHILPGFCTDAARDAIGVQRVFEMGDHLSCGQLQPLVDVSAWQAARLSFWRSITGWDRPGDCDLVGDTADLVHARRIVLWLEPSLNDQLTLAWLPALLEAVGASPEHIDLIQFPTSSIGISSLDPYAAPPPPMTLSPRDLDELRRAWNALVAPEPGALLAAVHSDYEPLPLFTRALRALLLRYPRRFSGVNAAELRLLEWSRGRAPAARIIGEVLGELVRGVDLCGDDWLFRRLLRLGAPRSPAADRAQRIHERVPVRQRAIDPVWRARPRRRGELRRR